MKNKDEAYMIEAGRDTDKKRYLAIWADQWEKENICLYKEEVASSKIVGKDVVDRALNSKCFYGKSFIEIANDIGITGMFGAG